MDPDQSASAPPGPASGAEAGQAGPGTGQYEALFGALPDAVALVDATTLRPLHLNPAMRSLLGPEARRFALLRRVEGGAALARRVTASLAARGSHGPEDILLQDPDGRLRRLALRAHAAAGDRAWLLLSDPPAPRPHEEATGRDSLTGLESRKALLAGLEMRLARGAGGCLLAIGLDDLADVNRRLGRAVGDQLLAALADRLDPRDASGALAARTGGDSFALLCPEAGTPCAARRCAEELLERLSRPLSLHGHRLATGVSIGVSVLDGAAADATACLARAEAARNEARQRGGGLIRVCDGTMDPRARVLTELRQADLRGELALHYQPIVSLETGATRLCEALLRWNRPGPDSLGAGDLTRLARRSAAMDTLRRFTVDEALRQHAAWGRADLRICINLSPDQIATDAALDWLLERLDHPGARDALVIEITESARFREAAQFARLDQLRAAGIALAIDDFGTGFSTLDYLARIPADYLKIDGSFTAKLAQTDYRKLLRAAIGLGRDFGMTVVAEGVETRRQADLLRDLGCDLAQGYAFGIPRPAADWGPGGP